MSPVSATAGIFFGEMLVMFGSILVSAKGWQNLTQLSGLAGYAMGNPLKYHESR
jgi:hypothetical protein